MNPQPWVTSPTLYPLGHGCPVSNVFVFVFFCQVKVGLERSGEVSGREKAWLLKYSHLEMRNLGSERPKSTTLSCFDIRTFSVNLFIMKPFIKPLEMIYAFFCLT